MANKFGLDIDASYDTNHTEDLAAKIFQIMDDGELCGGIAVVSWKHSDISNLANDMGCTKTNGCPLNYPATMYDEVWELNVSLSWCSSFHCFH